MQTAATQVGVRLKLSGGQAQTTSTVATRSSPLWMKDLKLTLPEGASASDSILTVELFDGEAKTTLASNYIALREVFHAGFVPARWVELVDASGAPVAKVCLRLKFKDQARGNRSGDDVAAKPPSSGSAGYGEVSSDREGVSTASDSGFQSRSTRTREERARAVEARAKAKRGKSRERGATKPKTGEGLREGETMQERGTSRERRSQRTASRRGRNSGRMRIPELKIPIPDMSAACSVLKSFLKELSPAGMLAAATGIFIAGNFSRLRGPPQYYEVQEGDSLCTIAGCYQKDWTELLDKNSDTITDPNIIYPGDKIRLS